MVLKNNLHSSSDVHTGRVGHNMCLQKYPKKQINIEKYGFVKVLDPVFWTVTVSKGGVD
jgi:hypothetical protein